MNLFKATLDTRHQNGVIGTITQFDNATLELQILTDGQVGEPWDSPEFELIAIKRDMNPVREVEQDKFTILSKEDHRVQIDLKEQFLNYKGSVKAQLVIKDGSRLSTTIFYLSIGQSLDSTIVESHRDVKVLDDLEAYVEKANHNLEIYEQRMDIRDEQFNNLNDSMNQAEAKRDQAELNRQQIFDVNEASRTRTFNNQMNNQETSFNDVQIERVNEFERDQTKRADDFVQAQNNREQAFNESQSANQSTFNSNEKKRQDEFNANQAANQKIFNDSESARTRTFEVAESERCENEKTRKEDESKRVSDEVKRVEAENKRQQKMQEFEDIANQIASDLQEQVTRVDEFVTANELKLLEEDARIDYMGNNQKSIRKVNEANVDYAVKTAIGEFNYLDYEGQHITANNSIEGHTKSAILKGQTLVNTVAFKQANTNASFDNATNVITLVDSTGWIRFDETRLKPSTKYIIIIDILECTLGSDSRPLKISLGDGNLNTINITSEQFKVGRIIVTETTPSTILTNYFNAQARTGSSCKFKLMVIEYQDGMENWDIPYFTGMSSVRMPVLQTTGKNLFDMNRPYDAITDSQATVVQDTNQITVSSANSGTYVSANFILDKDFFAGKTVTGSCLYESDIKDIGTVQINYQDDNGDHHYQWIKTPKTFTFPNNFIGDVMLCVSANNTGTPQSNTVTVKNIQLELGSSVTPYYEPHKSNILTVNEDVELGSVGEVKDELDLLTGKITQRTDIRPYQESDESDSEVLTDMTNTRYKLAQEVVKTVVLNDNTVYSYDGVTHYSCSSEEGSLVPTVSLKVPTDVQATITQQRNTIQALESENEALKYGLIEANQYREDGDMDLLSNQWDIDFRLFEIEMVLDVPMAVAYKIVKENDSMSRYLQAKTLILGGRYERSKMEYQLKRYLEAGQLTQEEYDELISLMDAREMLA